MALLSAKDVTRIEAQIEAVEAKSAGELVVAVVAQSDRYDLPRAGCAALGALLTMLALHVSPLDVEADFLLLGQVPMWLLYWRCLGYGPILRRLSSGVQTDRIVHNRAMQLFMSHGLYKTRDQSGLLIMISELEHRVVILGDAGIDAHIGHTGWQHHVKAITHGIKQGAAAESIISSLKTLGDTLAEHFPQRPDDVNELSNKVIVEN